MEEVESVWDLEQKDDSGRDYFTARAWITGAGE